MATYTRRHAEDILQTASFGAGGFLGAIRPESTLHDGNLIVVNDAGVWPDENIIALLPGERDIGWKPCWELIDRPDAPDPRETPGLPFPFTANQLAAWMLHGLGWFAREAMGEWDAGPTPGLFSHPEFSKTREVVVAAFQAYRDAESRVGRLDPVLRDTLDQAANARDKAEAAAIRAHNWRERGLSAKTSEERRLKYLAAVKPAHDAFETANRAWEQAHRAWRRSMVRDLLTPLVAQPAAAPEPLSRARAQEEAILAELVRLNYEPQALPVPAAGGPSEPKQKVKEALRYSEDVMNKAWKRLRKDGRIADANV